MKRKRDKKERLLSKEYLVKFLFAFTIGTASGIVIMMLILKEEFTFLNYLLRFTPMLVGGILGTIIMYLIYIYDKRFM